jgi:hypothetical protein
MSAATNAFENLNTGVVVSDPDFIVTYVNKRGYEIFDELKIPGLKVGGDMKECHKPETIEKLKVIYQEFADRKKKVHYYTAPGPEGLLTIVAVPFYDGDALGGVVEFVFESGLG